MDPLTLLALSGALGGGLGYLKNKDDKKNYKEEQRLNAVKARFSPWTHIPPTNPQRPGGTGSAVISGAVGMLPFGQALGASGLFGGGDGGTNAMGAAIDPTVENAALMDYGGPTNVAEAQAFGPQQGLGPYDYMANQEGTFTPAYAYGNPPATNPYAGQGHLYGPPDPRWFRPQQNSNPWFQMQPTNPNPYFPAQ